LYLRDLKRKQKPTHVSPTMADVKTNVPTRVPEQKLARVSPIQIWFRTLMVRCARARRGISKLGFTARVIFFWFFFKFFEIICVLRFFLPRVKILK
jgi:hypothetical protein